MSRSVFHVTVLSNFPRAFDKYSGTYDKRHIAESTYPDQFFVLDASELAIGIEKAAGLLRRLDLPGNRLLVLEAEVSEGALRPNLRNGRGQFLPGSSLPVARVHYVDAAGQLTPTTVEEAMAAALALRLPEMLPYAALKPRTVSVLPVALACQANCRFCFSKASVSADTEPAVPDLAKVARWVEEGAHAGAERFVITGGGEPGLAKHEYLLMLIGMGRTHLGKTVLITNGMHLARRDADTRAQMLQDYAHAGLSVLSISRHHHDTQVNADIMGLDTRTPDVLATYASLAPTQRPDRLRLICVLQKGGIDSPAQLHAYLDWAAAQGVTELCFKELYVSTTLESAYHQNPENAWARANQVPLAMVTEFADNAGFEMVSRLPWGAPVYAGTWRGKPLTIAAYTEPSLYWERANGVARSWNILANGQCLVSLEDLQSGLNKPGTTHINIKAI